MEKNLFVCYCVLALALVIATVSLVLNIVVLTKPSILLSELPHQQLQNEATSASSSKNSGGQSDMARDQMFSDGKVYVFAYDVPWEQYQYVSPEGELRGLSIDLIEVVCQHAGKKCQHIVMPIEYCWDAEKAIGIGLLDGWFDACAVFLKTKTRDNIFRYSGSFYKPKKGQFYSRSSESLTLEDVSSSIVGVKSNWYIGKDCLSKQNIRAKGFTAADTYEELYRMLVNETVDMVFVEENTFKGRQQIISMSDKYDCSLGSSGVMHKVDSDIPRWFNPSFDEIKRLGTFRDICEKYDNVTDTCLLNII